MASNSGRALVICGPSGSGKSTLLTKLLEDFPDKFGFSVSHTTRKPRPGEKDGEHYHFITTEAMKEAIKESKFLESATFGGNMYGTSKASVEAVFQKGKICVLDIDVQGVKQVKESDLNALYVFVKPPSLDVLEKRLKQRKTETEESLKKRLDVASEEIKYGETPGNFHLLVVNDDLDHAYKQLRKFVKERVLSQM